MESDTDRCLWNLNSVWCVQYKITFNEEKYFSEETIHESHASALIFNKLCENT